LLLDWALIATSAATQQDGALAILGAGTNTFFTFRRENLLEANQGMLAAGSIGTPVTLTIVARLQTTEPGGGGAAGTQIDLAIADGSGDLLTLDQRIPVGKRDPTLPSGWPTIINVVFNMSLPVYRTFGEHTVRLSLGGELKKTLLFRILPAAINPINTTGQPILANVQPVNLGLPGSKSK
jgi:hypothetical protein